MADCHPILFLRMMERVKAGAKLIVVDPRRTATADKADLFLQIAPGSDLALLNGLLHLIVENGYTDQEFIDEFTDGWDVMPSFLEQYTPDTVSEMTGIAEKDLHTAARWLGEAENFMSCWTMGLNQSTHGTWNTNAICNLHLATGAICKPGSGPFSLTGQPNAMGGREMGYMGPGLPGQRSVMSAADRDFVEDQWGIPYGSLRTDVGSGTIDMFSRMSNKEIKACWIICTNPVASVANRKTWAIAPQCPLDPQGRRVLRIQGKSRRLREVRPSDRMDRRDRQRRRRQLRASAARRNQSARIRCPHRNHGQGLRHEPHPRRLHGP